jgi:hypothetical protein
VRNLPRQQMKVRFLDSGLHDIINEPADASLSARPTTAKLAFEARRGGRCHCQRSRRSDATSRVLSLRVQRIFRLPLVLGSLWLAQAGGGRSQSCALCCSGTFLTTNRRKRRTEWSKPWSKAIILLRTYASHIQFHIVSILLWYTRSPLATTESLQCAAFNRRSSKAST